MTEPTRKVPQGRAENERTPQPNNHREEVWHQNVQRPGHTAGCYTVCPETSQATQQTAVQSVQRPAWPHSRLPYSLSRDQPGHTADCYTHSLVYQEHIIQCVGVLCAPIGSALAKE